MMNTESVCFEITGEFVTEHAREMVCDGDFGDAISLLVDGLPGLTYEQAYSILRGEQRLVGTNDVELVSELPEVEIEHLERLVWLYGGLVLHKRKCYRPYAYADNWGKEDTKNVTMKWEGHKFVWTPEYGRSLFYANNKSDLAKYLDITIDGVITEVVVLWEEVSRPPSGLQIRIYKDTEWQLAIDEYVNSGRMLEHRGYKQSHFYHEESPQQRIAVKSRHVEQEWQPDPPVRDMEFKSIHSYVLADGSYYGCEYTEHRSLAERILYHVYDKKEIRDSDKELDELNVIKTTTHFETGKPVIYGGKRRTEAQQNTLLGWALVHKADMSLLKE
jgi:hypothetical protein